ncbi:MAG: FRG domain-containing protein [Candidatus Homeothermus sp.]|nr:FRG domain-containing protein [Candidatus Homeothermus sp.]
MNNDIISSKGSSILSDYLRWIQDCYEGLSFNRRPLFFRGHADKQWLLLPAVFRNSIYDERTIILDYKQAFVKDCDYLSSMERILIEMQHHFIPTRLLDWSISPLVALFFACSSKELDDKDAIVYALNPWNSYKKLKPNKSVPTYYPEIMRQARLCAALNWTFEEICKFVKVKFNYDINSRELEEPLPIIGRYMDERVKTQQGCFTLWGTDKRNLNFFPSYETNLKSCVIEAKDKSSVLKSLSRLGINEFTLFTDKDGLSRSIQSNGSVFKVF